MSVSSVIVLCSTGHRVTVNTTPSKTLMSILEEVCTKRGLSDPSQFALLHHGKPLDLSNSIRFSNLPNKAQLDMVKSSSSSGDGSPVFVPVVFQLEDGTRLPPTTKEITTQTHLLQALFLSGIHVDPAEGDPAILYMRSEVQGWEALQSTTLRSIGITTDARVLVRFFYKNKAAPSIVSSGTCSSSKKSKQETSVFGKVMNYMKDSASSAKEAVQANAPKLEPSTSSSAVSKVKDLVSQKSEDQDSNKKKKSSKPPSTTQQIVDRMKSGKGPIETAVKTPATPDPDPITIYLDEHETVLAFDSSVAPRSEQFRDIDDAFFEHGIKDLQLLQKSNRKALKSFQDNDAPLMTSKMRKAEEESHKLSLLHKYKKSVIRIQFPPPRRYVLQVVCLSGTSIEELKERVKGYLKNPEIPFNLFITPPKRILKPEETLLDAGLVPASCVHFSSEPSNELREDVLSKLSNYTGANAACKVTKRAKTEASSTASEGVLEEESMSIEEGESSSTQVPQQREVHTKESLGSSSGSQVPKWFKLGKQ